MLVIFLEQSPRLITTGTEPLVFVAPGERQIEVLDLWSEDTKQDAWFTQSALDVGFEWMEKVFPNFHVYLFSSKLFLCISS